jgi:diguanylate cyclase (GGDEF)-like protein
MSDASASDPAPGRSLASEAVRLLATGAALVDVGSLVVEHLEAALPGSAVVAIIDEHGMVVAASGSLGWFVGSAPQRERLPSVAGGGVAWSWGREIRAADGHRAGQLEVWTSTVEADAAAEALLAEACAVVALAFERAGLAGALAGPPLVDALTGLPSRVALAQRAREVSAGATLDWALLVVDLDGFAEVNREHGHRLGDEVLVEVGRRIGSVLRRDDCAARLGSDEFAVLACNLRRPGDVEKVADRLLLALDLPVIADGLVVGVTGSVGVAVSSPGADAGAALARAELAVLDAKRAGKACWRSVG